MFDTEEKPTFAAQYQEPAATPENEAAEWAIAEQLAQGASIATGEPVAADELSEVDFSLADVLAPALKVTADIVAPNWNVTDDECQSLGVAWGNVIDVWFPGTTLDPKWAALGIAAATTAMVVKSRAGVPLRQVKVEKREEKEVTASE